MEYVHIYIYMHLNICIYLFLWDSLRQYQTSNHHFSVVSGLWREERVVSFEKINEKNQPFVSMSLDVPMFFIPVGGFNPSEKYESTWESSPIFGVNIRNLSNHQLESSPLQLHPSNLQGLHPSKVDAANGSLETLKPLKTKDQVPHVFHLGYDGDGFLWWDSTKQLRSNLGWRW